ncbi:Reverse transcriptase (RNA-dependent DNA polymerase) [Popillia japonica]|uniref:Reverse transcriptase (RNA-dependent DNA polymerase) n=1 Tax=Popillia japonica TaxID=7064 RepID=A0AAW1NBK2_POPJA
MMDSYLKDRCLSYETMSGERNMTVTSGAAQGSILGPDLWNILYDNLLRIQMPEEVTVVGYADDIAVLISVRRDVDAAQLKLNQAMRKIESWMQRHGLSLALNKTEIVILLEDAGERGNVDGCLNKTEIVILLEDAGERGNVDGCLTF